MPKQAAIDAIIFGVTILCVQTLFAQTDVPEDTAVQSFSTAGNIRAFHFVLRSVSIERGAWLLNKAHEYGFNTVIVAITDGVGLDSAPWTARNDAWTKSELVDWANQAKDFGLTVIPQIYLPSHQYKFLQNNYPNLMYNDDTYDVSNSQVYEEHVFPTIDEIVSLLSPPAFHIGHDEITQRSKKNTKIEQYLPASLFLESVIKLNHYLEDQNIETWMWGDMLIEHNEFPDMEGAYFNGSATGYGETLRHKVPKSIVINDWHYHGSHKDFPSTKMFIDDGHKVLGSTWKNFNITENFTSYASNSGASGMIATTWFHVQRREWELVDEILRRSGQIFTKYFTEE